MRIAIEVTPQLGGKRGVSVYVENLVRALARVDAENEYFLFSWFFRGYDEKLASIHCPQAPNFHLVANRLPDAAVSRLEWGLHLPVIRALLARHAIDVYHCPGPRLPRLNCRTVITIHDLIHELFPQWVNRRFLADSRRAALAADAIIADSEHTSRDISAQYGIPAGRIAVIPLGVDRDVFNPRAADRAAAGLAGLGLPEKFILEVGPFEPRRNTETLLKAYALARERIRPYKLVFVGAPQEGLLRQAQALGIAGDVRFTGRLNDGELAAVYCRSAIFAHLSLYEGFGLSVLEAMACGSVPVISGNTSLPEVGGNAAVTLPDPKDHAACAQALVKLLTDEPLRAGLRAAGLARAGLFNWDDTARKTLECYRRTLAS
jgi:glycosyltransferase involved in cell wall biosynthesis